ncbi:MAG TPA: hypothetical protein VLJ60_06040, partial [bacterium]|nr:hypothetical protein [bacterium]
MPFPTGMSLLNEKMKERAPWLWGVNGAASVVSSVSAISISIFYGISTTFFIGILFYVTAFISGLLIERSFIKK